MKLGQFDMAIGLTFQFDAITLSCRHEIIIGSLAGKIMTFIHLDYPLGLLALY